MVYKYIDMHCHCHELNYKLLKQYSSTIDLVCVSDDPISSFKTMILARMVDVKPCIGIHPWVAHEYSVKHVDELVQAGLMNDVVCFGEVGLDKRFYNHTFNHQYEIFTRFLRYASEYGLFLNIHSAGAWREVYDLLIKYDIDSAYFHWYTGPIELLHDIINSGYYIGVNPAWRIQEKHRRIIVETPVENLLTESDAPYTYHGLNMDPIDVIDSVKYISSVKNIDSNTVIESMKRNYARILH